MAAPKKRCPNPDPHPDFAEAISISRFWSLIDRRGADDCWPWLGDTRRGYGVFYHRNRLHGAHELALSFTTGEKRLDKLDTCHACDNPICCNPNHLRFDTRLGNVHDMHERGRARSSWKLTAEDVRLLRERRAAGARQKDLARDFGITCGQVSMIVRGLRWAKAGGPIEERREYRRAA